jgi:hypothetical protein
MGRDLDTKQRTTFFAGRADDKAVELHAANNKRRETQSSPNAAKMRGGDADCFHGPSFSSSPPSADFRDCE